MRIFFFAVISFVSFNLHLHAQVDPHFSQYYAYSLWMNPALTGATQMDYKATLIHRNQNFGNVNTFSTSGLSAEMSTNRNINIGLNILNQTATSGGYGYLNGMLSLAYTGIRLGYNEDYNITFGMNVGFLNRRFDPTKFQLGDQYESGVGYSPLIPTSDNFNNSASTAIDAGAGVAFFDTNPLKRANLYAAFSINHLTRPIDPFVDSQGKQNLPIRYLFNMGVSIKLSNDMFVIPNVLYARQGNAQERMAGLYFTIPYGTDSELIAGANMRLKDAIVPYAGFTFNNFTLGLSYDVNPALRGTGTSTNTFEISLTFFRKRAGNYRAVRCPVF
ncbi:PorP/SprF family type IX secretion system membrane protein [Pedobacter rhodius]|uniref:PorP/SprF family type IX secretion system membrane protein n=1 Tax=Pedobacter rhodius TaxID=3004098 RepID=A0ABT4KSW2_9SPHI|nr:PorP/SprF family type IX secretion system membrane protein [Pedobacter sp. SJ11]MCZ4221875.1 PorP/SprF family type IX secretion system membrane protein [Pedobacter sp. SJ11]